MSNFVPVTLVGSNSGQVLHVRRPMHMSELLLLDLPDEATQAYNTPDVVWKYSSPHDCDLPLVTYDDDTHRYTRYYVQHGWRVFIRVVEHAVFTVDSDGDWEGDCCSVDDPLYESFASAYDFRSCEQSWEGYYEHVIRTKNDYLREFYTQDPVKLRQDAKRALRVLKKQKREDMRDFGRGRVLKDPDGIAHWATYSRTKLWRTACGHYFPVEQRVDSEALTCIACLALK